MMRLAPALSAPKYEKDEGRIRPSLLRFRCLGGRCLGGRGRLECRLDRSLGQSADVDAERTLLASDAVDCSLGDQIAIELDGAGRVVIARNREIDLVRVAVG